MAERMEKLRGKISEMLAGGMKMKGMKKTKVKMKKMNRMKSMESYEK